MKKNSIKDRAKKVPVEVKNMVIRSMGTARAINKILDKQGKTRRELADMLGKKESEISKWMRGTHNFTYLTICKIEAVLGERLILLPEEATQTIYVVQPIAADAEQSICFKSTNEDDWITVGQRYSFSVEQNVSSFQNVKNKPVIVECPN